MASITIRDLDPRLKAQLRVRAARHGRSMEEEVRVILRSAMAEPSGQVVRLGEAIHRRFAVVGGVELELPEREAMRAPPKLR
jgi:plasmid stability protein